jgi:hypothetical protein
MTLEEFRASKQEVGKAALERVGYATDETGTDAKGLMYHGGLIIEMASEGWSESARSQGAYYLIIERSEYISDDLAALEEVLYDWAYGEGIAEAKA